MYNKMKLDNGDDRELTREQKAYIFLYKISEKIFSFAAADVKDVINSSHLETLKKATFRIIKMINNKNIQTEEKDKIFSLIELGFESLDYSDDVFAVLEIINSTLYLYENSNGVMKANRSLRIEITVKSSVERLINNIDSAFHCKILGSGIAVSSMGSESVIQSLNEHRKVIEEFLSLLENKGLIKKNDRQFAEILKQVGSNTMSFMINRKVPSEIKAILSSLKIDSVENIIKMCSNLETLKSDLVNALDSLKMEGIIMSDGYDKLKKEIFNTIKDNMSWKEVVNFIEADFVVNDNDDATKRIDILKQQVKQRMTVVKFLKNIEFKYAVYGNLEKTLLDKIFKELSKDLPKSNSADNFVAGFKNCEQLYNDLTRMKQSLKENGVLGEQDKFGDTFGSFVEQGMYQVLQCYIDGQNSSFY